jgi:CRISP-associated protein Cas1
LLVAGKLRNSHALLKRLNRRRKDEKVEAVCDTLKRMRARVGAVATIDQARGYEGEGAKLYYTAISASLEHGFALPRRRDDPANPVTGVLNYTASLLTRDMMAAVLRAGLHPGFGVLHAGADYRDACAWDLIEAFRAPLSEGLTVYLFNNRIIGKDDYLITDGTARLTGAASRRLVETYESWMARPIKNPRTGHFTTWRGLLLLETRSFAAAMRNGDLFTPYAMDH